MWQPEIIAPLGPLYLLITFVLIVLIPVVWFVWYSFTKVYLIINQEQHEIWLLPSEFSFLTNVIKSKNISFRYLIIIDNEKIGVIEKKIFPKGPRYILTKLMGKIFESEMNVATLKQDVTISIIVDNSSKVSVTRINKNLFYNN